MQQTNNHRAALTHNVPISPILITRRQHQPHHHYRIQQNKLATRRHLQQKQLQLQLQQQQLQLQQHQRPKVIRASEYKNLRQVVPSLRRQRDVGKVEVVTEAARYIDHLHKTLIERFVLCGIPDSLKDILETDDANELNSQHIMNLVTKMAAKQHHQQASTTRAAHNMQRVTPITPGTTSALELNGIQRAQLRNCARNDLTPKSRQTIDPALIPTQPLVGLQQQANLVGSQVSLNPLTTVNCKQTLVVRGNHANGFRKALPIVKQRLDTTISSQFAEDKSKYDD